MATANEWLVQLVESPNPALRQQAATALGKVEESNEEIVRHLLMAAEVDRDRAVRRAAAYSLKSKPNILIRLRDPEYAEALQKETRRRRKIAILGEAALFLFYLLLIARSLYVIILYPVLLATLYIGFLQWRCPACDARLIGWGRFIEPIWATSNFYCPECGTKIL